MEDDSLESGWQEKSDREIEREEIERFAAQIEPTRELYEKYCRFFYAVNRRDAEKDVAQKVVPHERAMMSFRQFCAYVDQLKERDPEEFLSRVQTWEQAWELGLEGYREFMREKFRRIAFEFPWQPPVPDDLVPPLESEEEI